MKRIAVIGGAGDMARVAEEQLLAMSEDYHLLLADIDPDEVEARMAKTDTGFVDTIEYKEEEAFP